MNERRVNLDTSITDLIQTELLTKLDGDIIKAVTSASEKLFKKQLSQEDIVRNYTPILRPHDTYDSKVRCKVNLDYCKVYDGTRTLRAIPENYFKNAKISLYCSLNTLWIMPGGTFGAVIQVEAILYDEEVSVCPFSFSE